LRVVKVSGNGYNRFRDLFTEIILGGLLHLHQNPRRNLGRCHLLGVRLYPGVAVIGLRNRVRHHIDVALHNVIFELASDQAFDREQCIGGVGDCLALGRLADQNLVVLAKRNDRRRGAITFAVLYNLGGIALHDCNAGVRGTKVDTNNFTHVHTLQKKVINQLAV